MNAATETAEVREIALEYLASGISVIPVLLDGSKEPSIKWKQYQNRLPTADEVRRWFSRPAGIGFVTGAVSGGLEVLDFDQPECFEPWRSMVGGLIERLPTVETASGGFHVLYRCREICGNSKIAKWEPADSPSFLASGSRRSCNGAPVKETRIESRGQGGYIVAPGSPVTVHPLKKPYCQCLGPPLPQIPTITVEERKRLWFAAGEFDCNQRQSLKVERAKREIRRQLRAARIQNEPPASGVTPWDDFDRRGRWDDILEPHGWERVGDSGWRRPGKAQGLSASVGLNAEGVEILTVFSSNGGALSGAGSHSSWGKFRAYAVLNCGGDGSQAAKELCRLGYGSRKEVAA